MLRIRCRLQGAALAASMMVAPALAGADAGFSGLGDLPGGAVTSQGLGLSADGQVVVGGSESTSGPEAFRWTPETGIEGLGDLPGGGFGSIARAASADGSWIVGTADGGFGINAYRWSAATGMLPLDPVPDIFNFPADTHDVSDDGAKAVGRYFTFTGPCLTDGYVWTDTGGVGETCADDPGGHVILESLSYEAVSGDGAVVVGFMFIPSTEFGAHRNWTFIANGTAYGTNSDGSVVVGGDATAWHWELGDFFPEELGDLPGGVARSLAWDVSDDGQSVVGTGATGASCFPDPGNPTYDDCEAFLWDPVGGMRRLQDELENVHGLDLTGWTLVEARAISDDGNVVVGWGTNPSGDTEGFVAVLETDCSNGVDDDGDGDVDTADLGCADAADLSERNPLIVCDDGADNDGDGLVDFPADPGCKAPSWAFEDPDCADGVNNDGDGLIDWDGGAQFNGGIPITAPDPQCVGKPWRKSEKPKDDCALGGPGLAMMLAGLLAGRMRRRG